MTLLQSLDDEEDILRTGQEAVQPEVARWQHCGSARLDIHPCSDGTTATTTSFERRRPRTCTMAATICRYMATGVGRSGSQAVLALAEEHPGPRWLRVVRAAYEVSRRIDGSAFAGSWVLSELQRSGDLDPRPGLQVLQRFGIVQKEGESTRGGNRAYYRMPDPAGVAEALNRLGY
jgi:hypothetical protein